jgi:hypothetical protein
VKNPPNLINEMKDFSFTSVSSLCTTDSENRKPSNITTRRDGKARVSPTEFEYLFLNNPCISSLSAPVWILGAITSHSCVKLSVIASGAVPTRTLGRNWSTFLSERWIFSYYFSLNTIPIQDWSKASLRPSVAYIYVALGKYYSHYRIPTTPFNTFNN